MLLQSVIEGPSLRELVNDVHSISLLVRSSVANLKFGLVLLDSPGTHTLPKLCSLGAANTWTLITLPNLPLWAAAATWGLSPGTVGYSIVISLAVGSTYTPAANDTWQNFSALGALGQSNFAASPVNSTFDLAFVQHGPGSACTTLIDKPFSQNYQETLRYFQKTYDQATAVGAVNAPGYFGTMSHPTTPSSQFNMGRIFSEPMAKTPVIVCYNYSTGVANSVMDFAGVTCAVSTIYDTSSKQPFGSLTLATAATGGGCDVHYTADTGW